MQEVSSVWCRILENLDLYVHIAPTESTDCCILSAGYINTAGTALSKQVMLSISMRCKKPGAKPADLLNFESQCIEHMLDFVRKMSRASNVRKRVNNSA